MIPVRRMLFRIRRFFLHHILRADDTPHRLALGMALGVFMAWTPTIGFQMVLVLITAPLIGANARVGVPLAWISNPLTFGVIYYPNYLVGKCVVGLFRKGDAINYAQIKEIFARLQSSASHFWRMEFWREIGGVLVQIGLELWVGSVIVGLILGAITYISMLNVIVWFRSRRKHRRGRCKKIFPAEIATGAEVETK